MMTTATATTNTNTTAISAPATAPAPATATAISTMVKKGTRTRVVPSRHYQICVAFKNKYPNVRMPVAYKLQGIRTGKWLSNQRTYHKQLKMKGKKPGPFELHWAKMFKDLGEPLRGEEEEDGVTGEGTMAGESSGAGRTSDSDYSYMEKYLSLIKFKKENGSFEVPPNHDLAGFVKEAREMKQSGLIPATLHNLLQAADFPWMDFQSGLASLAAFSARYGHCYVPQSHGFYQWCKDLRRWKREGSLRDENQVVLLEGIKFSWDNEEVNLEKTKSTPEKEKEKKSKLKKKHKKTKAEKKKKKKKEDNKLKKKKKTKSTSSVSNNSENYSRGDYTTSPNNLEDSGDEYDDMNLASTTRFNRVIGAEDKGSSSTHNRSGESKYFNESDSEDGSDASTGMMSTSGHDCFVNDSANEDKRSSSTHNRSGKSKDFNESDSEDGSDASTGTMSTSGHNHVVNDSANEDNHLSVINDINESDSDNGNDAACNDSMNKENKHPKQGSSDQSLISQLQGGSSGSSNSNREDIIVTMTEIKNKKVAELRIDCKKHNLDSSSLKPVLRNALINFYKGNEEYIFKDE